MNKPKTGMYLWFYAVLAFVLAIFGQTLLCGLLLAACRDIIDLYS